MDVCRFYSIFVAIFNDKCMIAEFRVSNFFSIKLKYLSFKSRKENRDIMLVETSPCTEFWFLLYFLPDNTVRRYQNYDQLIPELRKYMPGYEKKQVSTMFPKRYFIKTKLYDFLRANGNLDRAKANADRFSSMSKASPEDRIAYSEIHKVLDLLDNLNR